MDYYIGAFKKYADFKGRANKSEFWYFILFNIVVSILLGVVDGILGTTGMLGMVYSLAVFIPGISIGARRLHDIGKSGWMQLIMLIPLVGFIWLIILWIKDSAPKNEYGEPSKA